MILTPEQKLIKGYIFNYDTRFFKKNTLFEDNFNNLLAAIAYATIGKKLEDSISKAIMKEKNHRILKGLINFDELSNAEKFFAGFALITSYSTFEIESYIEQAAVIYEKTKDITPGNLNEHLYRIVFLGHYFCTFEKLPQEKVNFIKEQMNISLNYMNKKVNDLGFIGEDTIKPHFTLSVGLFLAITMNAIKDETVAEQIQVIITKIINNIDRHCINGFFPLELKKLDTTIEVTDSRVFTAHQMKYILFQNYFKNDNDKKMIRALTSKLYNEKENMLYSAVLGEGGNIKTTVETTPWVLWALAQNEDSLQWLDEVFDKDIPAPPSFNIIEVISNENVIKYYLKEENREWTEEFDVNVFDNIISSIINHWDKSDVEDRSPRSHGHDVLVLLEIIEKSEDQLLNEKSEQIIKRKLDFILKEQQSSGGWFYSQKNVIAQVYQLGKVEDYEFPKYQYTIDAAVAGRALVEGYRKYGDSRYLEAAFAALEYFEEHIGRVNWKNEVIWRLWPEDEETQFIGTGLNYELWNGWFFAGLHSIIDDEDVKKKLYEYIVDIITYTGKRIDENGDAIYSDPMPELRMPYALWDAFLLIEIGIIMDLDLAIHHGKKILSRTAEVLLPSGLIPFISNFRQELGKYSMWNTHSHGIGVYPVRSYYQLFHICDEELAPTDKQAALKSFGFYLLHFYDKVFNKFNMGLSPTGEKLNWNITPNGGDWLVKALININMVSNIKYKPKYNIEFTLNLESKINEHIHWLQINNSERYGFGFDFYSKDQEYHYPEAYALYGRGFVELYHKTGDNHYLEKAINTAKWLLKNKSNNFDNCLSKNNSWGLPWSWTREKGVYPANQPFAVTTIFVLHFLLDLYEASGNIEILNEVKDSIEWIINDNGYQVINNEQIGFYYSSHQMDQEEVIINAHSQVLGLLARCQRITETNIYHDLITKGLAFIEDQQLENALWGYGTINQKVEFHQSMVLDGLLEVFKNPEYKNEKLNKIISSGLDSYQDNFFDDNGKSYLTIEKNSEGWIQHTAIGGITFYKGFMSLNESNYKKMAFLILENLALNNKMAGGFYILSNKSPIQSIRGNAHMFYLLATLFKEELKK